MEHALLSASGLVMRYGGMQALDGLSMDIPRGGMTGLIGPNGAGKSTFMNCASGMVQPQQGSIRFDGQELSRLPAHHICGLGLVRTFQHARGFARMQVIDHLKLYAQDQPGESVWTALLGGAAARQRAAEVAEAAWAIARRLKFDHVAHLRITEVSGGQKKLVEIGRALMADPRMILLDEPMAGVNPSLGAEIGEHLLAMVAEGRTILLIEHDMALIRRLCSDVIVMASGAFLARGSFDEVCDDPRVQEAYLGRRVRA